MTNTAKARGTAYESSVTAYLNANGFPYVERRALAGNLDKGDLLGVPGWVLELKDHKAFNLSGWMDEAKVEAKNAGAPWFAVIFKRRRGKGSSGSVAESFVLLPLSVFAEFLRTDK